MDGFDTMTMSYMAAPPMSLSNVPSTDAMSMPLLPLNDLDHASNFDADTFIGSEDATHYGSHSIHGQASSLKRYPSQYDDPFSDAISNYDSHTGLQQDQSGGDNPSIDRDHKLLSFSMPNMNYTVLDYAFRPMSVSLTAQLHGMFFLAESPWATPGETAPPTELTCYRRNLFQVTGNLMLPRGLRYVLTEQGEQLPIISQELTISATESVEGNAVKIISVPWKTPASSAPVVEDKTEKEPTSIPLDLMSSQDVETEFVNFPIAWKRLQFRVATANNGRRKELQQHFIVHLKVMATLANGAKVSICEVRSGAVIVRGRSPRNFQSRKDMPISSGTTSRKHNMPMPPTRTSTTESAHPPKQETRTAPPQTIDVPQVPFSYEPADIQVSPDFFEWKIPNGHMGAMTAMPAEPASFPAQHPSNAYAQSSPDLARPSNKRSAPAPLALSLVDDEPRKTSPPCDYARKMPRLGTKTTRAPSFSLNLMSSPDESADLLYEYFPLGMEDWMPPVDAVYRPHVVHHTNLPSDPKALAVKNRSKRYFSEDQP
ncbi:hypothetical protein, variant [Verruconis gallopava]|nr:hypothetical protein, variant [Verruconis gallopava]KIW08056.1 hypothetical protein, variant [Verruconis gallopava]